MRKCGIICEYNPLHNGHVYQMQAAKAASNCDALICVMSGNFVQRGEGAILNKFERAKHAILAGADVVVELPAVFAINSAQDFAFGAVRILDALGCDFLHFGSEDGNIDNLTAFADFLAQPTEEFTKILKLNLDKGLSYPAAVSNAADKYFPDNVLKSPNNALAIEYIKAIKTLNSKMIPLTIKRENSYNGTELTKPFSSATAIRTAFYCGNKINDNVPDYMLKSLTEQAHFDNEKLNEFRHAYFSGLTPAVLKDILGVEEGLENRFVKYSGEASFAQMLEKVKSKRYTLLKLKRISVNAVLGITKDTMQVAKQTKPYYRILAIEESRLDILNNFSKCKNITPISGLSPEQKEIYESDIRATNLYSSLQKQKGNTDYTLPLQKVKREQTR